MSLRIPYYFVGTPTAVEAKDPQAVSGSGLGNVGADLKWFFPSPTVNYASTIHLGAHTGDVKKGFSTGHATGNWTNHLEHGWGNFTPFIDGGVGNTVQDTKYFHRPFMTSTNRKGYLDTSVQSGDASLARDNGFNASVEVKPVKAIDLEFDYSRSVPLRLNSFSFGISVDLGAMLRRASLGK